MKKVLAILLSVLMIICTVPMAFASSDYDRQNVAKNDAATIDALSEEQIAGVILDWIDRQIADVTADFQQFNEYADITGVTVPSNLDGIIAYKDHVTELGGDFANLNMASLKTRAEAGSDIAFLESVFQLMADNADTFGKVFSWTEGDVFDYGKVGEYIESDEFAQIEGSAEIKAFYEDYLVGGNIQEKFVAEIAREMGYTIADGEDFDTVINNGIKSVVGDLFKNIGLLDDAGYAKLMDDAEFNLRTENVYDLVEKFAALIQEGNKAEFDEMIDSFLSYIIGAIAAIKSAVNLEPPTVTISDSQGVVGGPYTPASAEVTDYEPTVYTAYSQYIPEDAQAAAGEFGVVVKADTEIPEAIAALRTGDGIPMKDYFKFEISALEEPNVITFEQLAQLASQTATQAAQAAASQYSEYITVNKVDVDMSYTGYSSEDSFICDVYATVTPDYTISDSIPSFIKGIAQSAIDAAIDAAVKSVLDTSKPVATIAVTNLNGEIAELNEILELVNSFKTEYVANPDLLNFAKYYDEYNGVVGQANRVLVDALKLVFTDEGIASLGLVEGGNENFTANLQKLCDKVNTALELLRKYVSREDFVAIADAMNIGDDFASAHGFNAGMVYDLDASSVENVLVCGIRIACDMLVEDESGLLYDIHMIVEDLDTLEKMVVGVFNYAMPKAVAEINEKLAETGIALSFTADKAPEDIANDAAAKDYIFGKLVDMLYDAADQAAPVIVDAVNSFISDAAADLGLEAVPAVGFELGVEKGADWEATLTNLVDRFYELTDGLFVNENIIAAKNGDVYAKIDAIANDFLPLGSMLSNAGTNGRVESRTVIAALDNCLAGNFDNFLRLFEVKDDALVGTEDSVTESLIATSEHMVDAVFPDTVKKELYIDAATVGGDNFGQTTVQEYFTGSVNDAVIAANNMRSLNEVKATFIPYVLRTGRELGVLPFFAAYEPCADDAHVWDDGEVTKAATCTAEGEKTYTCTVCYHTKTEAIAKTAHTAEVIPAVEATCTKTGLTEGSKCSVCGEILVAQQTVAKKAHTPVAVAGKAPTCTATGLTEGSKCSVCGAVITAQETIPATGHTDADGNGYCDTCNADLGGHDDGGSSQGGIRGFFAKIRDFFQRIIDWIRGLFTR